MKCGDCKYLGEVVKYLNPETDGIEATRFHLCGLLTQREDGPKGPEPCFSEWRGGAPPTDVDAFPIDGSGYYAAFVVAEDFGCVKFEPK